MKNKTLIDSLRATAGILQPFILGGNSNSKIWDGNRYADTPGRPADPQAHIWWSVLTTIAALLEGQGIAATAPQRAYLKRELFGGMGSLNDFSLDGAIYGDPGRVANERLREMVDRLFRELESSESDA